MESRDHQGYFGVVATNLPSGTSLEDVEHLIQTEVRAGCIETIDSYTAKAELWFENFESAAKVVRQFGITLYRGNEVQFWLVPELLAQLPRRMVRCNEFVKDIKAAFKKCKEIPLGSCAY